MSFIEKFNLYIDNIYWNIKFGKSKKRASIYDIRSNLSEYIKSPVFFLSTGRCGTHWFSNLLNKSKNNLVLHNPTPSLAIQSKLMYKLFNKGVENCTNTEKRLATEIYLCGREQYLRYTYKTGKRYIETNNYITFFAPILIELFPDAKFVHLYRHPGEFVRSGIRRNYYTDSNDDLKRIKPNNGFNTTNQTEKISWLWAETNFFIENIKKNNPEKFFSFNFNTLNLNNIQELLKFLEISIFKKTISKNLIKKTNVQNKVFYPTYNEWEQKDKERLKKYCHNLALQYEFIL